ncbi:TPA: Ger(x)C family spore germination protein [Bacillus cereus]|uniref:Ger(X)C family spore germination protein n=1 Tax=Bacillus cereus TaxID=1396 RepID=A0A1D3NLK3_BACCE|nr:MULTISPECIES: Ger(x)C family spore germination protein [Bacillus]MCP1179686.1 Ger(x)C family spore germination protein [Bacillus sp. 1663tsa1]MCP1281932.1 Ger(x)C family spore germination protein [Bacillus sp. S0635]MCQ6348448.1 Ger(x)C family spore germination protein [Bacillus cereus]MCU5460807.1 Ger(x)C family spore germination protein [Bacillus cereus]MCU5750481.1 Ger(x)C family spore germination protein [Bacillus cereus]
MKRFTHFTILCFLTIFLTGCGDRLDLEKQSISLVYGFDKENKEMLKVYQIIPVFNKDVEKKYETHETKVHTPREAKAMFNSSSSGLVSTEKLQIVLLSNTFLKQEGAMPYLDVWYRDPKNTGNMRIVAVQGPVSSIIYNNFKDKPDLPEHLTELINTNKLYNRTVYTTFHEFHRQTFNKGITPAISEIKKDKKEITVTGSALLTSRGIYKMSLNRYESALLLMLQEKANTPVSLTMHIPSAPVKNNNRLKDTKEKDFITINVFSINRYINTGYNDNHFKFNVGMNLNVAISEITFNMDIDKDTKKLTALITKQLNKDLNELIHNIQKQQLDPFGFGDYARAFQYKEWKTVEDDWPSAFSKANVKVTSTIKILENGIIK